MRTRSLSLLFMITVFISACTVTVNTGPVTPVILNPTNVAFGGLPTFDSNTTLGAPTVSTTIPGTINVSPDWNSVATGIGWRQMSVQAASGQSVNLIAARAIPANVRFRVLYQAGQARSIQDWHAALPDALMIVNANYFDPNNNALGLVVSDSQIFGSPSNRSDAGLFQVTNNVPRLRSLWLEPFNAQDHFEQAAQGYPLLMAGGQVAPINADLSTTAARRTVFAQDKSGNFLFIVVPFNQITLTDLESVLTNSGLNIDTAINMDGGQSTCLYLAVNNASPYIPGVRPVPIVLAVYPR